MRRKSLMSDNTDNIELSKRKKAELESRLEHGLVQVRLNSTVDGVSLPEFLMYRVQVTLNLSYAFRAKVFVIDEDGVQVTLSFSGEPFLCILPWDCLYFMQSLDQKRKPSGRPELFVESIPEPVLAHYGLSMHIVGEDDEDEEEDLPLTRPILMEDLDDPEEIHQVLSELKDWAQSLEKIDTKNRDHKWPFPLEVIYEVVEGLESQHIFTEKSDQGEESEATQKRRLAKSQEEQEGEHTPEKGIISLIRFQRERQDVKSDESTTNTTHDAKEASKSSSTQGQILADPISKAEQNHRE